MSGTKAGSIKAVKKIKDTYGDNYFAKIGALGGKASGKGGFWHQKYVRGDVEPIREAGRKGGSISRRKPKKPSKQWLANHGLLNSSVATHIAPDPLEGLTATHSEVKKKKSWRTFWT